jgi:class 3 adenylate cyclase
MRKIIVLLGLFLLIVSNSFSQSTPYLDLVKKLLSKKDITFNQLFDSLASKDYYVSTKPLKSEEFALISKLVDQRFASTKNDSTLNLIAVFKLRSYLMTHESGKAILVAQEYYDNVKKTGNYQSIINALRLFTYIYSEVGMIKEVINYSREIYAMQLENAKNKSDTILADGDYAWPLSQGFFIRDTVAMDSALVLLQNVINYCRKNPAESSIMGVADKYKIYLMTLARQKRHKDIIQVGMANLTMIDNCNFLYVYSRLGTAYANLNNHDSAFYFFNKPEIYTDVPRNTTTLHPTKKRYIEFYEFRDLVKAHLIFKEYKEAVSLCEMATISTYKIKNPEYFNLALELTAESYLKAGMFEKAAQAYAQVKRTSDSLNMASQAILNETIQTSTQIQIKATEDAARLDKENSELQRKQEKLKSNLIITSISIVAILAIVFFAVLFDRFRTTRKQKKLIEEQAETLAIEKHRSDELLLNILPSEVAEELKLKGSAEAKLVDDVTVLFTDFKGFTELSEKLSPKELLGEINICFSEFDHIMQKYGIEKIKTIGDSYMAAGGIPVPNKTHAFDVVSAALEIQKFMFNHKQERQNLGLPFFDIRIGIHTGPVVAGIVGVKKFAYDIWGDTVNTASRMESSGESGQINISGNTYQLVKDKFDCSYRGKIMAKNKGEIDMYFVNKC